MLEKINWVVKEYIGLEVYKVNNPGVLITKKEDLQIGDKVTLSSNSGPTFIVKNGYVLDNGNIKTFLQYAEDDRGCWVALGFVNMEAIKKLHLNKEKEYEQKNN